MNVHFEHIAIAVHEQDYAAWDGLLRGSLGGSGGMGGDAEGLGFRGVQIAYPCGGMIEIISWSLPGHPKNPIVKYVERHGPRAALHHLTFLVDSVDAARARCRELGYEFMQGRDNKHWKEIYLRAPFFEPPKMLIQLLEADKEAFSKAGGASPQPRAGNPSVEPAAEAPRIVGARMACSDPGGATDLFCTLIEATDSAGVLTWPRSSMRLELVPGAQAADSHIAIEPSEATSPLEGAEVPAEARSLFRRL